ncbi:15902_t:CDS:2, partial [Cetraspora pellucida]
AEKLAIANFKFSQHWLGRFLKRYDLSLRCKTNIAQKLPDDLENKLLKFQQFVIRLCQKNNYPLGMKRWIKYWNRMQPEGPHSKTML